MNYRLEDPLPWRVLAGELAAGAAVVAGVGLWAPGWLPSLNALLNLVALLLLVRGYGAIRHGQPVRHRNLMLAAFVASVLFLASYLVHHARVGHVPFRGQGAVRAVYLAVLFSHVVLAAVVPFLAVGTIYLGLKGRWQGHRRLARWTWPLWVYVSVTGIAVYVMLYHWGGGAVVR